MRASKVPFAAFIGMLLIIPAVLRAEGGVSNVDVMTPKMRAALDQMSDEDFNTRNKGLKAIENALGEQFAQLLNLPDEEQQERIGALLNFQEGLTRWGRDLLKFPADQRKSQIQFAMQPAVLPTIAKVFSNESDKRMEGIRELAPMQGPAVDTLLAHLVYDQDRSVYVTAMDVIRSRPASSVVINALWDRAIGAGVALYQRPHISKGVTYKGKTIGLTPMPQPAYMYGPDNDIATDTLIQLNAPEVGDRIVKLFQERAKDMLSDDEAAKKANSYLGDEVLARNLYVLTLAYKPGGAVEPLYQIATAPALKPVQMNQYGQKTFHSSRTPAIAAILTITGQDTKAVGLKHFPNQSWAFTTMDEETAALEKLHAWHNQQAAEK